MTDSSKASKTRSKFVDERDGATELWVYRDGYHYPHVTFSKPKCSAVRYVLPADPGEIERLRAALQFIVNSPAQDVAPIQREVARKCLAGETPGYVDDPVDVDTQTLGPLGG